MHPRAGLPWRSLKIKTAPIHSGRNAQLSGISSNEVRGIRQQVWRHFRQGTALAVPRKAAKNQPGLQPLRAYAPSGDPHSCYLILRTSLDYCGQARGGGGGIPRPRRVRLGCRTPVGKNLIEFRSSFSGLQRHLAVSGLPVSLKSFEMNQLPRSASSCCSDSTLIVLLQPSGEVPS